MKKYIFYILPLLLLISVQCSRHDKFNNQIIDKAGKPIPNVKIVLLSDSLEKTQVVYSNHKGQFYINEANLQTSILNDSTSIASLAIMKEGFIPSLQPYPLNIKTKNTFEKNIFEIDVMPNDEPTGSLTNIVIKVKDCPQKYKSFFVFKLVDYPYKSSFTFSRDSNSYQLSVPEDFIDTRQSLIIISEIKSFLFKLDAIPIHIKPKKQNGTAKPGLTTAKGTSGYINFEVELDTVKNLIDFPNRIQNVDRTYKINREKVVLGSESNNFENTIFYEDNVVFSGDFEHATSFKKAHFTSKTIFRNVTFDGDVDFSETQFFSEIEFNTVTFNGFVDFRNIDFGSKLRFYDVHFDSVSFKGSQLPHFLELQNVIIDKDVDMVDVKINLTYEECNLSFAYSDCHKINIVFDEHLLWFDLIDISPITEDELNKAIAIEQYNLKDVKAGIFRKLLARADKEGYSKSHEIIDKKFKEFNYLHCEGGGGKPWFTFINWLQKTWWGYGYDKELIIRNTFAIFLLFVFINIFILRKLTTSVYTDPKIVETLNSREIMPIVIFLKRIPMSVFYTSIIFFVISIDLKKLKYKENLTGFKWLWLFYFGVIYISGLVCMGYLANFVLTGGA